MKTIFSMVAATTLLSTPSFAWTGRDTEMSCSGKGGSVGVVMDTDKFKKEGYNIVGKFHSEDFDFWSKGKSEKDGVEVYKDEKSKVVVKVQWPGPDDGDQDTFWGEITKGSTTVKMGCSHHSGGPDF